MPTTTIGYESTHTGQEIDAAVDAVLGDGGSSSLPERTGAAEAAIASLEGSVAGHTAGISELQSAVAVHGAALDDVSDDISSLSETVAGHSAAIGSMEAEGVSFGVVNNVMASGSSVYREDVAEIYLTGSADVEGLSRVSLKCFNDRIYMKGFGVGSALLYVLGGTSVSGWVDNRAYGLVCSQSECGGIAVGETGAFIVFRDIAAFRGEHESSDDHININLRRARSLSLNPIVASGLAPFVLPDGGVTGAKLADGAVTEGKIAAGAVTVGRIADGAVVPEKTSFFGFERMSKNLCNPVEIESGKYIRTTNGKATNTSTANRFATGFIPIDVEGVICNKAYSGGTEIGYAYYDSERVFMSGRKATGFIPYIDGAAYVRMTLNSNDGVMVNRGSELLPYEAYTGETRAVIGAEYLPEPSTQIEDGGVTTSKLAAEAVTEEKLAAEVVRKLGTPDISINLPSVLPCRVGDTLRIYWRSVVVAPDPYIYDIYAVGSGKSYPRYYEHRAEVAGTETVTVFVKDAAGKTLRSRAVSIVASLGASSPASQTNILVIGASATASGHVAGELKRRLTESSGDGTALNPTGLGLQNIAFVGRKTGTEVVTVNQEATGGWSWLDYATKGRKAYRFVVSGVDTLCIGSTYRNNGTTFTIEEINVTEGSGNIRCTFSPDSGSPAASGSLTRSGGGGDGSISFSAATLEEFNPFWNEATGRLDFGAYADDYCGGHIDVLVSHCGVNDIATKSIGTFPSRVEQYLKPFVRAFHAQFPDGIFVFSTLPIGTPYGGFAASYGAHSQLNYYLFARKVWKVADCVRAMAEEDEFKSYFFVSEVTPLFDAESLYPTGQRAVALRSEETETVQTNAVHPAVAGRKTVADCIFGTLNDLLG